jgi:hypothetical protein
MVFLLPQYDPECPPRSAGGVARPLLRSLTSDCDRNFLQATEDFMVHLFEDTNLCAIHAKRVTISESSQLACRGSDSRPGFYNSPRRKRGKTEKRELRPTFKPSLRAI